MPWTQPASTRTLALLRIGFATLVWTTWGNDLVLSLNLVPHELVGAAALMLASTAMLLGWWSRTAAALTAASLAYMLVWSDLTQVPLWPDVHAALLVAVPTVLAASPCGRSLSVDRYLAVRRSVARGQPVPGEAGDVRTLAVLLTLAIGAQLIQALTLTNAAWLSGYTLERIVSWQALGSVPPGPGMRALLDWAQVVAIAACVLAWGLALALAVPASRRWAAGVGALAQLLVYLFVPAGTGPLVFALLYLAALDPDRAHALIDELVPGASARDPGDAAEQALGGP